MAYCPKCGVEVDHVVRECPLCKFPIPDISEAHQEKDHMNKFPEAKNIYEEYRSGIKNRILFVLVILMISTLGVLAIVGIVFEVNFKTMAYIIYGVISLFLYIFFLLGYLHLFYNITGIAATTLLITYVIESLSGGEWFMNYALPIVGWVYVNTFLFSYLYKHSKRKRQFSYLPTFALLIITTICIGIDGVISLNIFGRIHLTWSVIQGIASMTIAFILYAVLNHLPGRTQEILRRKMHM